MEECVCALDETLLIDFNKLIDDCYARDEERVNGGGAENNVDFLCRAFHYMCIVNKSYRHHKSHHRRCRDASSSFVIFVAEVVIFVAELINND